MGYLIKLAFLFFQKPDLLWVQVLHTKYFKEVNGELKPRNRNAQSAIWRGISKAWPLMLEGARASIRNGVGTTFWTTRWLDSGIKLIDHVEEIDDNIDLQATVRDLVMEDGDWDLDFLRTYIKDELIDEISGMSPLSGD
ncbi:hypothetical protein LINPERHAP2_LOCUS5547 [Linum perenne]